MPAPKTQLGPTEVEVLRYLGENPAQSVGEVAGFFAKTTGQARTTILTIMERLRKKGHLKRKQVGGVYKYSPKVESSDLLRGLVKTFVKTTLGGSVSPFVAYLAEDEAVSEEDLRKLKQLVRDLERDRKGGGI